MKFVKKFLMTIISVFLVLLVTFNVYNFVSINLLHKDMATVGGYALLEVVSGSMEPTIYKGDIIVIDVNCKEYTKGDIITFRDINDAFVTHRIQDIDHQKNIMITQGDANESPDDEMSTKAIVGKYVLKIPAAGKLMSSFKNPLVMILILIIGIIVCALVSTDDNLTPKDMSLEEKEFLEFKKQKEMLENTTEEVLIEEPKKTIKKAKKETVGAKSVKKAETKPKQETEVKSKKTAVKNNDISEDKEKILKKGEVKGVTKKTSSKSSSTKTKATKGNVNTPKKTTSTKTPSKSTGTKKSSTKKNTK